MVVQRKIRQISNVSDVYLPDLIFIFLEFLLYFLPLKVRRWSCVTVKYETPPLLTTQCKSRSISFSSFSARSVMIWVFTKWSSSSKFLCAGFSFCFESKDWFMAQTDVKFIIASSLQQIIIFSSRYIQTRISFINYHTFMMFLSIHTSLHSASYLSLTMFKFSYTLICYRKKNSSIDILQLDFTLDIEVQSFIDLGNHLSFIFTTF